MPADTDTVRTPVAAGLDLVRSVVDEDGALPASFKALLLAAANAVRARPEQTASEVERAARLGADPALAWAVTTTVLSSRGEGAYALLRDAVAHRFGPQPVAADVDPPLERDEAYAQMAGSADAPAWLDAMADHAPNALRGYLQMRDGAWAQPAVEGSLVQLVLVCLNAAEAHDGRAAYHANLARTHGATDAELVETLICTIPVAGITAWYATAPVVFS